MDRGEGASSGRTVSSNGSDQTAVSAASGRLDRSLGAANGTHAMTATPENGIDGDARADPRTARVNQARTSTVVAPKRRPCQECRVAKARCEWPTTPAESDGDSRCIRCKEKNRACTVGIAPTDPSGRHGTTRSNTDGSDSRDGLGFAVARRARWVCEECKRKKRACVGGKPIYRTKTDESETAGPANQEDGDTMDLEEGVLGRELVGLTPCDYCKRKGLDCRWRRLGRTATTSSSTSSMTKIKKEVEQTDEVLGGGEDGEKDTLDYVETLPTWTGTSTLDTFTPASAFPPLNTPLSTPLEAAFPAYSASPATVVTANTPVVYTNNNFFAPMAVSGNTVGQTFIGIPQPPAGYSYTMTPTGLAAVPTNPYGLGYIASPAQLTVVPGLGSAWSPAVALTNPMPIGPTYLATTTPTIAQTMPFNLPPGYILQQAPASPAFVPQTLSPLDHSGAILPSSDCLQWLISRFWNFHGEMGRNIPIHRPKFLRFAWSSSGESSPLLWILLWGTTVFLDTPANRHGWQHSELTLSAKAAIRERARASLMAGLQTATADLAAIENGSVPLTHASFSKTARQLVPVLQGLTLGMLFYERAGGARNMVALVSLIIRLGAVSAQALKGWIVRVSALVSKDSVTPTTPDEQGSPLGETEELERWIREHGLEPPFQRDLSLAASMKSPSQLRLLGPQEQEDVVLLAEYAACFFFAYGVDAWAADLLGIPLNINREDVEHVPVPFDTRGFEEGDEFLMPYYGSGRFTRWATGSPGVAKSFGAKIVPIVPMASAFSWIKPAATAEHRQAVLAATITDCFRVGPHLPVSNFYEIERSVIHLRFQARMQGYQCLYPVAIRESEQLRAELNRIRNLYRELLAAFPKEVLEFERQGNMEGMFELTMTCPTLLPSISFASAWIWLYDSMACLCSPPPEMLPEDDWYQSQDGLEAAQNAVRAARLIQAMLDFGFDVNNGHLLSWFHTKIDRIARILFLHLRFALTRGLPSASLFQTSMISCLNWFQGLGHGERYAEWLDRLTKADLHISPRNFQRESSVASEDEMVLPPMVLSAEDKALEQYREQMQSLNSAVESLV